MTRALAAFHDTTYGGVYYSDTLDFTDPLAVPTWTKLAVTGLANNLVKAMQNDYADPYGKIYVQLDNDDVYLWNGASWDKIIDLATARTTSGLASGVVGYIAANKTVAGRVYLPIAQTGVSTRVLVSTDYGSTWTSYTVLDYAITTVSAYVSARGDDVWVCYGHLYRSLQYSGDNGATWDGDYAIWPSTGGGDQINIDNYSSKCYYYVNATNTNLVQVTSLYAQTTLQSGKDLGQAYASTTNPDTAGNHNFSKSTSGKQRTLYLSGVTHKLYTTTDGWTNLVEATPTNWYPFSAATMDSARENDDYVLFGLGGVGAGAARLYGWVGNDTSSAPWNMSGANYAAAPYANSFPSTGTSYVPVYGVFVGNAPGSPGTGGAVGVYVYADEQGDITALPSYTGLGSPMFGDRASWRDRNTDGFDVYHAEDVERNAREIHTPQPTGNDGYGIIETGGYWVNTSSTLALSGDVLDTDDAHEHIVNEDHTVECNGVTVTFLTDIDFRLDSTAVYLNGVRQLLDTDYTEAAMLDSITMTIAPETGDRLIIDYICTWEDGFDMAGRKLISEQTPTGTGTVTFSSIPAIYRNLEVEYVVRSTQAATNTTMSCFLNNDTTAANYRRMLIQGYGTNTVGGGGADDALIAAVAGGSSVAGSCGMGIINIIQYAGTTFKKQVNCRWGYRAEASSNHEVTGTTSMEWESTNAVSRVDLVLASGNFATGSTIRLYGVY